MTAAGGPPLVFPPSATCLWDEQATGEPVDTSVDGRCWVCVRLSQSVLQLAVRASRQTSLSPLSCLLLGSASISERGGVVVEVDRFDLGRSVGVDLEPTALVPGDVIIHCSVGSRKSITVPESGPQAEKELLWRLETSALPAPNLLHIQLHITTPVSESHFKPLVSFTCCCLYPGPCTLTPVRALPIVPTALARNLAGPHSLSVLQSAVKWGYLTMEVTRKLVVLLHSDPKSQSVPLVGVWVSGVSGCTHPAVWATLLHYKHYKQLRRMVERDNSLCLVYSTSTQPVLFQFHQAIGNPFTYSTAELEIELCSASRPPLLELIPRQSPTFSEDIPHLHICNGEHRATEPQPCPLPTLAKVSQLSAVSLLEKSSFDLCPKSTMDPISADCSKVSQRLTVFPEKVTQPSGQEHSQLTTPYKTPATTEKGTNTGLSLVLFQERNASAGSSVHVGADTSAVSTVTGMEPSMAAREVSLKTESSVPVSINLDLCSFAASSLEGESMVSVSTTTLAEDSSVLSSQQFYQNMLESVEELLQTPVEGESVYQGSCKEKSEYRVEPEVSILPIPQIASISNCAETTLDETAHAADVITMKYVDSPPDSDTTNLEPSTYLQMPRHPGNSSVVLDLGRLRSLPKLL